jgi:site-specific recombinase XerD
MDSHQPSRLLRSFERYLRAGNRSERTIGNYLEGIRQAEAFLHRRGVCLEDVTRADLEDFIADLLARRSAATAATRYKVLRILYGWLQEEEDSASRTRRAQFRLSDAGGAARLQRSPSDRRLYA